MTACPECGAMVAAEAAACPSCGHATADSTRICEHCKEEIAADAPACPACGHLAEPATCELHPDRAAAGQCVLCGRTVCDECDTGMRKAHRCQGHADVPVIEGWAQVYSTGDDVTAELIRENLQAEGIDSRVLSQKDHFSFTVDIGDLSPVRVLVPAYAYEEARGLIQEHMDDRGEVAFACPSCGEAYERGTGACSECGEVLAAPPSA